MSVNYLRLIPTDPTYDPPLTKDQQAEQLLAVFVPKSTEITSHRYESVQFVDAGSNWEAIHCPGCRAILEACKTSKVMAVVGIEANATLLGSTS